MSNAIQFLETLGRNPAISSQCLTDHAEVMDSLEADDAQRQALMGRDAYALSKLLNGRSEMLCMVATPDGGETQDEPEKHDDGGEEPDGTEDAPGSTERPS